MGCQGDDGVAFWKHVALVFTHCDPNAQSMWESNIPSMDKIAERIRWDPKLHARAAELPVIQISCKFDGISNCDPKVLAPYRPLLEFGDRVPLSVTCPPPCRVLSSVFVALSAWPNPPLSELDLSIQNTSDQRLWSMSQGVVAHCCSSPGLMCMWREISSAVVTTSLHWYGACATPMSTATLQPNEPASI